MQAAVRQGQHVQARAGLATGCNDPARATFFDLMSGGVRGAKCPRLLQLDIITELDFHGDRAVSKD